MEAFLLRRRRALDDAGDVIRVWRIVITQIELYCSAEMYSYRLAQCAY
jgi:hypothetical protein